MAKELMQYIPKEYKKLVVDIQEGEDEWNDVTKKWNTPVIVEWANGIISRFANKTFMKACLKEFHAPDEFGG